MGDTKKAYNRKEFLSFLGKASLGFTIVPPFLVGCGNTSTPGTTQGTMKKYILILSLVICTVFAQHVLGQSESVKYRHTLETSPLSPVLKIYGLQYGCLITQRDELLLGFVYANIKYDAGQSHAPTLIIGYRRYLWKNLHVEYQVWPAFNDFFEFNEKRYYSGFEVWNEFRLGYKFELSLGNFPISITPQILSGFGLYEGNKPRSFKEQVNKEPVFVYPNIFVGVRF